jgi:hypothetical protein
VPLITQDVRSASVFVAWATHVERSAASATSSITLTPTSDSKPAVAPTEPCRGLRLIASGRMTWDIAFATVRRKPCDGRTYNPKAPAPLANVSKALWAFAR